MGSRFDVPPESLPTAAQPDLPIDLEAQPRDGSDFATLVRAIKPLLDNLSFLDVVESGQHHDISFLAQEPGKSAEQIMRVVVAARLEAAFDIPTADFYAFVQQRVSGGCRYLLHDRDAKFCAAPSTTIIFPHCGIAWRITFPIITRKETTRGKRM